MIKIVFVSRTRINRNFQWHWQPVNLWDITGGDVQSRRRIGWFSMFNRFFGTAAYYTWLEGGRRD